MLALRLPLLPLPPLCLDLDPHGFRFDTNDCGTALENTLVDLRCTLESVVSATQDACAVQTQHITRDNARHAEWKTNRVALLDEIGKAVDVHCDVVARLSCQKGEEVADGVVDGSWRSRCMALLQGQRSDLASRRVGSIINMLLRDRLDDRSGRVEEAGADGKQEGRRKRAGPSEGGSQLCDGAKQRPAHVVGSSCYEKQRLVMD